MSAEEGIRLNITPETLAKAKVAAAADTAERDDHPEGAAIRRQVRLINSIATT